MTSRLKRGAGNLDAVLIIAFLIFVMLVTPRGSGPSSSGTGLFSGPTLFGTGSGGSSSSVISSAPVNAGAASISLNSGNAAYSYQPYEEYIEMVNWGDAAINITGWRLKNGKDKRAYDRGGTLQRYSADIAVIPQATRLLSPSGGSVMEDVILGRGERAILTTGTVGVRSPYAITSFKENKCTGYLERLTDYAFQPPLTTSCPRPENEPGVEGLDRECRRVVESLSSCQTPSFGGKDSRGDYCANCLNGTPLSSHCKAFIEEHFSYRGCIAYHAGDSDFSSGRTWRIFLGRSWEMWAEDYESIELFDRFNNLVSAISY